MRILTPPFADYCNLTVPRGEYSDVLRCVESIVLEAGGSLAEGGSNTTRIGDGTLKCGCRFGVGWFSYSGAALEHLRRRNLLGDTLAEFGAFEHRVTRLDVAVDLREDGPLAVRRWYRRGKAGKVAFTSSRIPPQQVQRRSELGLADGRDTGGVYLGSRKRDVYALVYDKRQHLLKAAQDAHGTGASVIALNDPGPLTRYEMRFGRHVGMTLGDVHSPAAIFYHHAGGVLLPRPAGTPGWRAHAEGFTVERKTRDAAYWNRQIDWIVENSNELRFIRDAGEQLYPNHPEVGRKIVARKVAQRIMGGGGKVGGEGVVHEAEGFG